MSFLQRKHCCLLSCTVLLSLIFSCKRENPSNPGTVKYTVSTIAGGFNNPTGVSFDRLSNVVITDNGNDRIATIHNGGMVTTLAGGQHGALDGPGNVASFNWPSSLAPDVYGNLYVTDYGNGLIRKVTPDGVTSTFSGQLNSPNFNHPAGIGRAPNEGFHILEEGGSQVKLIGSTGVISVLAGNGKQGFADGQALSASFDHPFGIDGDRFGNLYVADTYNNRIRKISTTGTVSTFAGTGVAGDLDGPGNAAQFNHPMGIAFGGNGNLYVADCNNHKIRMIDSLGKVITIAGSTEGFQDGPAETAKFSRPTGIVATSGYYPDIFVTDAGTGKVRKVSPR